MLRTVVAAMCAVLAVVAPSSASGSRDDRETVRNPYIVVLNPTTVRSEAEGASNRPLVSIVAQELARSHGGAIASVYQYALKGFAVQLTEAQAAALADDPRVAYVEADQVDRGGRRPRPPPPGGSTGSTSATCRSTTPTPTTRPARASTPT